MLKRLPGIFLILFMPLMASAQQYGNEWIPFSLAQTHSLQQYFKISVTKAGVFRLSNTALLAANVPVSSIDHRRFQLFQNGIEQHIYVNDINSNNFLDAGDYIEFYGKRNDGWLDAQMYDSPSSQANPNYSMITDTAAYFLTWNSSLSNKRLQVYNDTNFGAYVSSTYFFREIFREYTNTYYYGSTDAYEGSDPEYTEAEGWFNELIDIHQSDTKTLPVSNLYSAGPASVLDAVIVGSSNHSVYLDHHLQVKVNNNLIVDTIYDGYKIGRYNNSIPNSWISGGSANILYSSLGNNGASTDKNAISWFKLRYPHTYSFAGESDSAFKMIVPYNAAQAKTLASITGFSQVNSNVYIYDMDSKLRIPMDNNAGTLRALIPNSVVGATDKNVFLFSENSVTYLNSIKPVNTNPDPSTFARFTNYNYPNTNYNYIIITHKSLMTSANAYKDYRNTTGYNAIVVDVDELYNQFAYGINKHPLAIRNFGKFAYFSWPAPPKHMFLIGKSINAIQTRIDGNGSVQTASILANYANNLVPTFGNPAADPLFTIGYNGTLYTPAFPVGRLSARNNADVTMYLNKVISQENQPPADWMKHILHFGGGSDINEQNLIKSYLLNYEETIEGASFGGFVHSYFKTNSDPIQINQSNVLKARIDSGVTMMTFFAHANNSNFDISTDQPSTYSNKDKYPLILANACYAGDIHTTSRSQSEDFVLQNQKGAIGFIAQVFLGYREPLNEYSRHFYRIIGQEAYGTTIGEAMVATIDSIEAPFPGIKTVCLEMTLHGDPAVRLNPQLKPDMIVTQPDIYFTPANISTELDSFDVNVVMTNIGRSVVQQFNVEIKRTFPDGSTQLTRLPRPGLNYKDTVSITLPVDFFKGSGLNKFDVILDPDFFVDEYDNFINNTASNVLNIQSNDITPAYPYEFAIVPTNTVVLKASTSNPFASARTYIFEIDTIDTFSSQIKQRISVTQKGGIVKTPGLNLQYQTVYYWRVSVDSSVTGTFKWKESSFICKNGINGWSQAHFPQFKNDKFTNIQYNSTTKTFDYVTNLASIQIINALNLDYRTASYSINNSVQEYGACGYEPSIHIAVIDSFSLEPWGTHFVDTLNCFPPCVYNPQNSFGNVNDLNGCRKRVEKYFIFQTNNPAQRTAMKNMINSIPNGNHVIAYSSWSGKFESWENDIYQTFEDMGADSIRFVRDNEPYIFLTKKGDPSSAYEVIGHYPDTLIELNTTIQNFWSQGYIQTPAIGPAKEWSSIHWEQNSLETVNTDSVYLDVIGIRTNGSEILLMPDVPASQTDLLNLSTLIPAAEYPYIRLRMNTKDETNHTPAQLKRWQVYYQGVPEAALNPNVHFTFSKDTIQQGENISMSIAVENISPFDMDSLLVDYYVFNNNKVRVPIKTIRQRALPAGDTLITRVSFSTEDLPYLNSLWVEANPRFDQPEQAHYNNLGEVKFFATRDVTNPVLDVTFDGVHILDGDIVSVHPEIVISLNDENKYLAVKEPNNFQVFVKDPNGNNKLLYFESAPGIQTNDTLLRWFPASLPKNSFRIEYKPKFTKNGIYELKVQGKDASDNLSGRKEYRVSFEVNDTSMITQVMNYPNPFSTSTRFVFTLTGSEVPTYFKIQILTVTGKIVREITGAELGPIRIGRNITEYAWDGRDEFGDRLANGVYLYRVITRINDSGIELRKSGADLYFKSGFGKMYLMR